MATISSSALTELSMLIVELALEHKSAKHLKVAALVK
jgi:hypothetical protein